jgi:hypothetical protein
MTLFTAVDVRVGAFEFDGTEALLRMCKRLYGGRAPTPVPDASRGGRLHVGRQQLIEWLGENGTGGLAPGGNNVDWFHENMLPLGVESTIHTVNQTLVTVQATYLLPAAVEAAAAEAGATGAGVAGGGGGGDGGPGEADGAVHAKLMADSTQLG